MPAARRFLITWLPINPAPPVTRTVLCDGFNFKLSIFEFGQNAGYSADNHQKVRHPHSPFSHLQCFATGIFSVDSTTARSVATHRQRRWFGSIVHTIVNLDHHRLSIIAPEIRSNALDQLLKAKQNRSKVPEAKSRTAQHAGTNRPTLSTIARVIGEGFDHWTGKAHAAC